MKLRMLTLVSILMLLFSFSANSFAHAMLERSAPANNEVLTTSPNAITLYFNQDVNLLQSNLTDKDGNDIPLENEIATGETLEISLPILDPNTYEFNWGVISEDGHPINGSLEFTITE